MDDDEDDLGEGSDAAKPDPAGSSHKEAAATFASCSCPNQGTWFSVLLGSRRKKFLTLLFPDVFFAFLLFVWASLCVDSCLECR